jgi:hypothetical protein
MDLENYERGIRVIARAFDEIAALPGDHRGDAADIADGGAEQASPGG